MITGAHAIIRDVLGLPNVDVGGGWLIFGLPPSEVAVHPADENGRHELYFIVDDVKAFIADMRRRKISSSAIHEERWGLITEATLPGGGKIGVYEPLHERPPVAPARASRAARPAKRASKPRTRGARAGR